MIIFQEADVVHGLKIVDINVALQITHVLKVRETVKTILTALEP